MSSTEKQPSANSLAIDLGKRIGKTRQTCGAWIRGTHSPEKTIKGMVGDVCLSLMLALSRPGETFSLREISRVTGWSHERIRQIEEGAIRKLRKAKKTREVGYELRD